MKFGKYLESEKVSEWPYMDYKALKKQLKPLPYLRMHPPSPSFLHGSPSRKTNESRTMSRSSSITELRRRHYGDTRPSVASSPATNQSDEEFLLQALGNKDSEEQMFFSSLDNEVDKAQHFYQEREEEARKKYDEIESQCRYLNNILPSQTIPQDSKNRIATAKAAGKFREWATAVNTYVSTKGITRQNADNADAERQQSLQDTAHVNRTSIKSLRQAMMEYYRSLQLLKNYQTLNRVALEKSLKKYGRHFEDWGASGAYIRKTQKLSLFDPNHDAVSRLIAKTERLYASTFADGDKKRAMQRLRLPDLRQQPKLLQTWRSGIYLGVSLGPIYATIHGLLTNQIESSDPYTMLQVYAGFAIPILMALFFSIDLYMWSNARINYVFIFQLDPRNFLVLQEYIEIASFALMTWSIFLYLTVIDNVLPFIPSRVYPVIFAGLVVLVLINPFNVTHKTSRYWLLSSLMRLVLSGLYEVEFRDFFLADQLNSMNYLFLGFMYFGCALQHELRDLDGYCTTAPKSWLLPVVAGLPPLWRLIQCGRRWIDNNQAAPHALNAVKYILSLAVVYLSAAQNIQGTTLLRGLWIFFSICASLYATAWDIFWDWGLGRNSPDQKHPFLRTELSYPFVWLYYLAMPLDLVLRFGWAITLSPSFWVREFPALGFILAVVELGRRTLWNLFRMENEHLGNVGKFRAFIDMPLPFTTHALSNSAGKRHEAYGYDSDEPVTRTPHFALTPKSVRPSLVGGSGHLGSTDSMGEALEMEPLVLEDPMMGVVTRSAHEWG
ncbi:hypothetical protein SeMB42_g03188 [Synchytrium endobioticum]|uniref:EXS domain-containing protein n=1 Tax=Synchytrium endobioticum TaxID=286115 RepID=A0A507D900_9FUNG|nr:hypothetical protein SeMB42_g03188 [Synchytrium endobioticum]